MASDLPTIEQAAAEQQSNQLRFILDVILRHWLGIFVATVLAAIAGAVVGVLRTEQHYEYSAVAELVVRPSLYDSNLLSSLGGSLFGKTSPKTVLDQTSKRGLAEDVARALVQQDVAEGGELSSVTSDLEYANKAAEIESRVTLEDRNEAGVLVIHATGNSGEEAQQLADTAARVMVEQSRQLFHDEAQRTYELVQEELDDLRQQLDEAESRQWAFREELGFQTSSDLWNDMESMNQELSETQATIQEVEARLREINATLAENSAELTETLGNVSESTIERLKQELDELMGEKAEKLVDWLPDSPGIKPLDRKIKAKQDAILIAIEQLGASPGAAAGPWEQRKELQRQKAELEFQLASYRIRVATLQKLLDQKLEKLPELSDRSFEYEQLAHEAEQIRSQFNKLLEKEFEIRSAQNRAAATLERRDGAVVASAVAGAGSPIWAMGALGGLIGFVCSFGGAMMREMMDTSIKSAEDANHYIELDVIGMIPMMKFGQPRFGRKRKGAYVVSTDEDQIDACIVTQHDPKSPISEAYRTLRTNFQFATIQSAPRTVMITSAVPGEGKTTTAVNFAVTMADRGMRVLIIDTDLRRPNVHRVLRMERGPGLADVLRERVPVKNVIRPTRVENLWIISSGRVPPNPSELMGSERMSRLIGELGETFDLVVCDAPSILVVTDPVLLATHVDTVGLVVSVNNARRETIQRAKKLLETANPFIAGVILNGLEATRRHYYYYYYYYDDQATPAKRRWYHNL